MKVGFELWVLGFRSGVCGVGFPVEGLRFGFCTWGSGFGV